MHRLTLLAAAILAALAMPAMAQGITCSEPLKPMLRAELFFGRNIGDRLGVSERQWAQFVRAELTPRFPDGLTVIDGRGQWREQGRIVREPSKIVIVVTADEVGARERLAAAAAAYKQHFKQQSVAILTRPVCAAF